MRDMTKDEEAAYTKAQAGYGAVKEGLLEAMAIARKAGDMDVLMEASEAYHAVCMVHTKAGKAMIRTFKGGAAMVARGPGR